MKGFCRESGVSKSTRRWNILSSSVQRASKVLPWASGGAGSNCTKYVHVAASGIEPWGHGRAKQVQLPHAKAVAQLLQSGYERVEGGV